MNGYEPPIEYPGASEIQRLEDDLREARAEVERLQRTIDAAMGWVDSSSDEIERLRAALESIERTSLGAIKQIAHASLNQERTESDE